MDMVIQNNERYLDDTCVSRLLRGLLHCNMGVGGDQCHHTHQEERKIEGSENERERERGEEADRE